MKFEDLTNTSGVAVSKLTAISANGFFTGRPTKTHVESIGNKENGYSFIVVPFQLEEGGEKFAVALYHEDGTENAYCVLAGRLGGSMARRLMDISDFHSNRSVEGQMPEAETFCSLIDFKNVATAGFDLKAEANGEMSFQFLSDNSLIQITADAWCGSGGQPDVFDWRISRVDHDRTLYAGYDESDILAPMPQEVGSIDVLKGVALERAIEDAIELCGFEDLDDEYILTSLSDEKIPAAEYDFELTQNGEVQFSMGF